MGEFSSVTISWMASDQLETSRTLKFLTIEVVFESRAQSLCHDLTHAPPTMKKGGWPIEKKGKGRKKAENCLLKLGFQRS